MMKKAMLSLVLVVAMAAVANASVLSITSPSAGTWQAFILSGPTTAGISSFIINVNGSGGIAVLTSTLRALQTTVLDNPFNTDPENPAPGFQGFSQHRGAGAVAGGNTTGIQAGQSSAYDGAQSDFNDFWVYGSVASGIAGKGVTTPYLVASGTYSGTAGALDVVLGAGFVNTLNIVSGGKWIGPGNVSIEGANLVTNGHLDIVPEPATLSLLALSGIGILLRRRRA